MIRYGMAAATAKLFSANAQTKRLYRKLGNALLTNLRTREGLPERYVERARWMLGLVEKHGMHLDGKALLEVGTGWVHWESICIRLFHDASVTLFDVWDNRLFDIFKLYVAVFRDLVLTEIELSPIEQEHVLDLIGDLLAASSFDEVYQLLGFRYVIEPSGTLGRFEDKSFDFIYSCDVLEHVNKDILSDYIQDFGRLLKPGGYSVHQIDTADHLAYYAPGIRRKNYLRYSDRTWKLLFENDVQYINRMQRSQWLDLFHRAGLELVEEVSTPCSIDGIKISGEYSNLSQPDLECMILQVVHRKPE